MAQDRFTYQVVEIKSGLFGVKPQAVQDELNKLGAHGWELVTVMPAGVNQRLILKRAQ